MPQVSAGLLMFTHSKSKLLFFLVHPGGPLFTNKDEGYWSLPKGLVEEGEEILETAKREFAEETGLIPEDPYIPVGQVKLKSGKIVHGWAFERKSSRTIKLQSNQFTMEWPPKSGKIGSFDEIDKGNFFTYEEAKIKINEAQFPFIERLSAILNHQQ